MKQSIFFAAVTLAALASADIRTAQAQDPARSCTAFQRPDFGGATQVLGTADRLTPQVAANIGFDGLLVALLGRNRPWGTLFAAILYGGLRAGGNYLQSDLSISVQLVSVIQALIVVFIAAPALVKTIFHLRAARSARLGATMAKGW